MTSPRLLVEADSIGTKQLDRKQSAYLKKTSLVAMGVCLICALYVLIPRWTSARGEEEIGFDAVGISLIKVRPTAFGWVDLYFKLENKIDRDIHSASFECYIFDKGGQFVENVDVTIINLKRLATGYADAEASLPIGQFGRAECRSTGGVSE